MNTIDLYQVKKLTNEKKFDDVIALITDEKLEKVDNKDEADELYIWRGNALYSINEFDKAISDYSKAIDINPNYLLAYYNRGLAWINKEDYDKAIKDYDKAIEIDPNCAYAYADKASIERGLKKYDEAIENYNKAINIDPNIADTYYNSLLSGKTGNLNFDHDFTGFQPCFS